MKRFTGPRPYLAGVLLAAAAASQPALAVDDATAASLIEEYCVKCHNFEDYAGGVDLEGIGAHNIALIREAGESVIQRLRAGMMPPAGEPRPAHEELQGLAEVLERRIDEAYPARPGRVGMHRLNRTEYQNAVRDLLDLDIDASELLPADDSSNGFDNQAGALTFSPALLEAYLSAAARISELALGTATNPTQKLYRVAEDANQNLHIEGLPFGTRGGIKFSHNFPADGEYRFRLFVITAGNMGSSRPFGEIRGEKLLMLVDGQHVTTFDWDSELGIGRGFRQEVDEEGDNEPLPTINIELPLKAGPHEIAFTFLATNYAPVLDLNNDFERSTIETGGLAGFTFFPHVGSVRIDGPYAGMAATETPSRDKLFVCYPLTAADEADCARRILANLAELAYRGYATDDDVEGLMDFYRLGRETGNFDAGIGLALQKVLTSPKFIYRLEQEPEDVPAGAVYALDDLDLASRLSFFLWSSIPDRELLDLARAGRLHEPEVLEAQVRRMLADPRGEALAKNFAGQWLALRNLDAHVPVIDLFPDFEDSLRQAYKRETELFFQYLIEENRPVTELLTADYTFVNERLALHYGIPDISGERFRKVPLDGDLLLRRGILGKGSTLTVASQPGRTSPVIRGFWILSNVLGVQPPPPPPNVPELPPTGGDSAGNTALPSMRELLEQHRENPACQGCHRLMDPIGFALENFDAVGTYRTIDNGNVIDPTGFMYDGTPIETSADLVDFFMQYEDSIVRNVTQKLLTYGLGRGIEYSDMPMVREVMASAAADGWSFQSLIMAVVRSPAFLHNEKADGPAQAAR